MCRLHLPVRGLACAVGLAGVAFGCAGQSALVQQYEQMRPDLVRADWNEAVEKLKAARGSVYGPRDRVMYWLNLGTLLHYDGQYDASMQALVKAEETMQELWTKSISAEASRFVVNETSGAYAGSDHERVLVYLYTALNRLQQGRVTDALVEARRADERLRQMRVAYEREDGLGAAYEQDAFILWLVGLLYEIEGSYNDAYLTYRASARSYAEEYAAKFGCSAPAYLAEDIVRAARLAGLEEEAARMAEKFGADGHTFDLLAQGWSEVIVVHGNGEAPRKEQITFETLLPDGYYVRVALPDFVVREPQVQRASVRAGGRTTHTVLAEPVSRIAAVHHEAQLPAIKARAVARAAVKYAASAGVREAVKGDGEDSGREVAGTLLGILTNAVAAATEAADLRAWTTLPGEVRVARLWLPPGEVDLEITFEGAAGRPVRGHPPVRMALVLEPGERRVVPVRSVL